MNAARFETGLLQVYTGDGKGKTTAAIGLAVRAAGHDFRVIILQFMKGRLYGELNSLRSLPNVTIEQHGRDEFVKKGNPDPVDLDFARKGFARAKEVVAAGDHDLVVLDEINVAVDFGLIPVADVVDLVKSRPAHMEIVCTGRYAPKELLDLADLVTEMKLVRHPFDKKINGRLGIEF